MNFNHVFISYQNRVDDLKLNHKYVYWSALISLWVLFPEEMILYKVIKVIIKKYGGKKN
jgi:hypothetical protein